MKTNSEKVNKLLQVGIFLDSHEWAKIYGFRNKNGIKTDETFFIELHGKIYDTIYKRLTKMGRFAAHNDQLAIYIINLQSKLEANLIQSFQESPFDIELRMRNLFNIFNPNTDNSSSVHPNFLNFKTQLLRNCQNSYIRYLLEKAQALDPRGYGRFQVDKIVLNSSESKAKHTGISLTMKRLVGKGKTQEITITTQRLAQRCKEIIGGNENSHRKPETQASWFQMIIKEDYPLSKLHTRYIENHPKKSITQTLLTDFEGLDPLQIDLKDKYQRAIRFLKTAIERNNNLPFYYNQFSDRLGSYLNTLLRLAENLYTAEKNKKFLQHQSQHMPFLLDIANGKAFEIENKNPPTEAKNEFKEDRMIVASPDLKKETYKEEEKHKALSIPVDPLYQLTVPEIIKIASKTKPEDSHTKAKNPKTETRDKKQAIKLSDENTKKVKNLLYIILKDLETAKLSFQSGLSCLTDHPRIKLIVTLETQLNAIFSDFISNHHSINQLITHLFQVLHQADYKNSSFDGGFERLRSHLETIYWVIIEKLITKNDEQSQKIHDMFDNLSAYSFIPKIPRLNVILVDRNCFLKNSSSQSWYTTRDAYFTEMIPADAIKAINIHSEPPADQVRVFIFDDRDPEDIRSQGFTQKGKGYLWPTFTSPVSAMNFHQKKGQQARTPDDASNQHIIQESPLEVSQRTFNFHSFYSGSWIPDENSSFEDKLKSLEQAILRIAPESKEKQELTQQTHPETQLILRIASNLLQQASTNKNVLQIKALVAKVPNISLSPQFEDFLIESDLAIFGFSKFNPYFPNIGLDDESDDESDDECVYEAFISLENYNQYLEKLINRVIPKPSSSSSPHHFKDKFIATLRAFINIRKFKNKLSSDKTVYPEISAAIVLLKYCESKSSNNSSNKNVGFLTPVALHKSHSPDTTNKLQENDYSLYKELIEGDLGKIIKNFLRLGVVMPEQYTQAEQGYNRSELHHHLGI